jgi:parvulin-like peptidyl-prolyl isomerase
MNYTLPRPIFDLLLEAMGDKQKAETFARAIESSVQEIDNQATESILEKKQQLKAELYDSLRTELATKEFVRAEIGQVRAEISEVRVELSEVRAEQKNTNTLVKIMIGLMIFGLTIANPGFIELIKTFS